MADNQNQVKRRPVAVPTSNGPLHQHYVRAINSALAAGREHDAHELAAAYANDLRKQGEHRTK